MMNEELKVAMLMFSVCAAWYGVGFLAGYAQRAKAEAIKVVSADDPRSKE